MASLSFIEGVVAEVEVELIATEAAEQLAATIICNASVNCRWLQPRLKGKKCWILTDVRDADTHVRGVGFALARDMIWL